MDVWQCHQVIHIVHLSLGRKERPLSCQNVTQYNNQQIHIHDSVTNYNIFNIWPEVEKNVHCLSERHSL
jgi:hypothetical protein